MTSSTPRVILNADDFGFDEDTLRATIECFEQGALTSATIMPKMPATARAIEWAIGHPEFSFGVHLTFVDELPLSEPSRIPDLVDETGRFLRSNRTRVRAMLGRIPVEQIELELAAQLTFVRDQGLPISHVDSHGHLHKFGPFRSALRTVLPRFGIRRVRSSQDVYLAPAWSSPTFWLGVRWRARLRSGFRTTDHLAMPACDEGPDWKERLLEAVRAGRTLEVGVHPGYSDPSRELQRVGVQWLAGELRDRGVSRITWNEL